MRISVLAKLATLATLLAIQVTIAQTPSQGVLREVYTNIPGVSVSDLTNSPAFPASPDSTNYLTDAFEAPIDIMEDYGQRVRGYVVPPTTGNYTFWISSDDGSTLFLSTDEQPTNRREIASVASWTASREWTKESTQQSNPIRLESGRRYYIEALMKEGGGGDNLAVRWQLPDGTMEEPIPGQRLLPFGVSFTPPIITQQPTNTTVMEGELATFEVRVSNLDPVSYQWQSNRVALAGANGGILNLFPTPLSASGALYRCMLTNSLGSTNTIEATLTVTPDTIRPRLTSLLNIGPTNLNVTFSEGVAGPSSITKANYTIDQGVTVTGVTLGASPNSVILVTSPFALGTTYTLTVNNVTDRAVTPNPIEPNSQMTFRAVEYAPADIGSPSLGGTSQPAGNGYEVSGSGLDIGGNSDQFHFEYAQRTGNFDLQVRLAGFSPTDPWAKAGLMARETLDAGARFTSAFATPATVGCFMMTRSATGSAASITGRFPGNYPETWLRLQRVGNTFTAYASYDGQSWSQLGTTSLALPSTLYVGTAVTSRNTFKRATAQFRDYGTGAGTVVPAPVVNRETIGPSTRRTGLVFSEIMYNPAFRADTNELEFVEIYNAGTIFEDMSGFRLSGAVDYVFPEGTILPAGGVLVVAQSPASMREVYGLQGSLGPYDGSLANEGESLRLRDELDSVLLEVPYSDGHPWPRAADGTGHSLVLARPSYGETDPQAWAISERIGGSPGTTETVRANPWANVVINEFLAHTDDPVFDFIELYNHGNTPVDLSGCALTDDPSTNKFIIPEGTLIPARGFLSYDQNELGFALDAGGETIYLVSSNATRVIDAVRFAGQQNGVASGRSPDGAPTIRTLDSPTPRAANAALRLPDIVINELMFDPITRDDDDEFVELYNRGGSPVDLSGWRFTDGIDFRIPTNTVLASGGYLAVAKSLERLLASYPTLNPGNTIGDYSGNLANSGERLTLSKPDLVVSTNEFEELVTNTIWIVVTDLTYGTGGRWPERADGGGSSLELIDPHSDSLRAANWAASDETAKAPWSTVQFTGVMDNGNGSYNPDFQMMTLGGGEYLVDDVEVIGPGNTNRLRNPGFTSSLANWVIQGNHRASTRDTSGGVSGACLHVRATGRGDTGANRIYSLLANTSGLSQGATVTLRAKVRWLAGWPEFLLRLRGNWIEAPGTLSVPRNLGTPGARNSRAIDNAGPAIFDVTHTPILPQANQAVVVSTRVSDPTGIARLDLFYRLDGAATHSSTAMNDTGSAGDAVANDGIYSATLSARSAGTMVSFYISATDTASAVCRFPANAPTRECLVRWGESEGMSTLGNYRLWQRQADVNALTSREPLANDPLDCTFVYGNQRIVYNAQVRAKGSPWHSGSIGSDWVFAFPDDDKFLGGRDMAVVTIGNLGSDDSGQREQAAYWMLRKLGSPYLHRRYVRFLWNGTQSYPIHEDTQEPTGEYISQWFPDDDSGDLHKIEDWFEFADDGQIFSPVDGTLQKFTTAGGQLKLARYRWDWRKRAVQDSASNYTNLFNLVNAANLTTSDYTRQFENLADTEQWMRCFMIQHVVGNWDAYGYNRGKNCYAYKPVNGKWAMIAWDIDFVLGSGSDGATTDIFGTNDPTLSRMYGHPPFLRACWRAIRDACDGPLRAEAIGPMLDAKWKEFQSNGLTFASPNALKSWINSRRTYLLNRLASVNYGFSIATGGGNDFSTNRAFITLTGNAPIEVKTIEVNGVAYPGTWTTVSNWSMSLPLLARTNALVVTGRDLRGNVVSNATRSLTITYTGTIQRPEDFVVINEIHYNSAQLGASFIEIHNTSTQTAFDLTGWRLDGVGFTFPEGAVLQAGAYLVVAANATDFAAAYGLAVLPIGEFPGNLDNGGETLKLVRPGAIPEEDVVVDLVRYDDDPPWTANADGFGPSLQLIDPAQDNWRVANWTATATNASVRATPGLVNTVRATLPAFPTVWINEVQPENLSGPLDRAGDRDPWIEIHNPGTAVMNLGGLYLSASFTNLTEWQFPADTLVQPGQFLVIYADGEPAESAAGEPHTSFRLPAGTGQVALCRLQSGSPVALDYLAYNLLSPGRSYGDFPDAHPESRHVFHLATSGGTNDLTSTSVNVSINEWMASNTRSAADPADGDFDDWFELYNAGPDAVDLTAYTLTDILTNTTKFSIPAGTIIPANGYLLVWADEETGQNGETPDLHANFKLAGGGEAIGLFAPDGQLVDAVTFGQQTNDVSQGRWPDGQADSIEFLQQPTPREANLFNTSNHAPELAAIGNRSTPEGELFTFIAQATDADAGQVLTFTLDLGAPAGASVDPASGQFTWTPQEADGPGVYTVTLRVSDDGAPRRRDFETFTITVAEVNRRPVLEPIADVAIDEGSLLALQAVATDLDLPANIVTFTLANGAPDGATIDPVSGAFSWQPAEIQGGANYEITVRATDNGSPAEVAARTFRVVVNKFDNPPRLQAVASQTIDEGVPFELTASAVDPDLPPSPLIYTIEGSIPSGLEFDGATGHLRWTPTEPQGPGSYLLTVRATETTGLRQSDSVSFTLAVREVSQAPSLEPIADIIAQEGDLVTVTNRAADPDLPAQRLSWSLEPGAPAGATIDPVTGVFRWVISRDQGAGSNPVTVRVLDDGTPALHASQTFSIVVRTVNHVAIHEVMYAPAVANGEYIEIYNNSKVTLAELGGLLLEPVDFTFPIDSVLAPGAYAVVVHNRAAFTSAYGSDAAILGEYPGSINPAGDTIRILRSGPGEPEVLDAVRFSSQLPWPTTAATGGASLQVVDPDEDNDRPWNWAVGDRLATNAPVSYLPITHTWRYNQSGTDLGTTWRTPAFNDSAWPTGAGLLYVEPAALPAPKNTPLQLGPTTFYFRTHFNFTGNPTGATLLLTTVLDDGAIVHLNGQPIWRLRMPEGEVAYSDFAIGDPVSDGVFEGPFRVSVTNLLRGDNVLAVEVHQINAGSSDVAFGLALDIEEVRLAAYTPGAVNSVLADLLPAPAVTLNEVLPANTSGITDAQGDRDPWIELHNAGDVTASLDGWSLTDSYANLTKWPFPAGTLVPAHGYLLVWADGEPAETTAAETHTSFRLNATAGQLALVRTQNSKPAVIDYLDYQVSGPNQAYGSRADGDLLDRGLLGAPTPGDNNSELPPNRLPTLDSIADRTVPAGSTVQFTATASDPDTGQTLAFTLDPGAPSAATLDMASGLFIWVIPAAQTAGDYPVTIRVTDNGTPPETAFREFTIMVDSVVLPDSPVLTAPRVEPTGDVTLTWSTAVGKRYRVEFKNELEEAAWSVLTELTASTTQTSATDNPTAGRLHRYYRVILMP